MTGLTRPSPRRCWTCWTGMPSRPPFSASGNGRTLPLPAEIVRRGHTVENHSQQHRHEFAAGSAWPRAGIAGVAGHAQQDLRPAPLVLRPGRPAQPFSSRCWPASGSGWPAGRHAASTPASATERVKRRLLRGLRGGAILLLHDGHAARTPTAAPRCCWKCCPPCSNRPPPRACSGHLAPGTVMTGSNPATPWYRRAAAVVPTHPYLKGLRH